MPSNTGDWSASADVLGQFFYILLVLAIVILIFLFFARLLSMAKYGAHGKNISLLGSLAVAPQSAVQILRVGGRQFLIGVTKGQINLLADITGEALNEPSPPVLFDKLLKKCLHSANGEEGLKNDKQP